MADEEILPFLLTLSNPTFFTRDLGFASVEFCHERRCLVILAVGQYEVAHFVRQLLQHRAFNTQAKRMGVVIRITSTGLVVSRPHAKVDARIAWVD